MTAEPGLDGGLLVGGDDVVVAAQSFAFPFPGVQIEHPAGLDLEVGVSEKIHDRCRQGRMASSESHRQIVVPEISATMPRVVTSLAMSGTCSRDSGTPNREGSSQANALTATTTSGGKDRGSTAPGALFEPGETLLEEPLTPLRDDLASGVQPPGDLVVVESLGGHEHDLGSDHFSIRQRISARLASSSRRWTAVRLSVYGLFLGTGSPLWGSPYVTTAPNHISVVM